MTLKQHGRANPALDTCSGPQGWHQRRRTPDCRAKQPQVVQAARSFTGARADDFADRTRFLFSRFAKAVLHLYVFPIG